MHARRPDRLTPQQATIAVMDQHDDRRVGSRKLRRAAVPVRAPAQVAGSLRARGAAAPPAVPRPLVPVAHASRVGQQGRLELLEPRARPPEIFERQVRLPREPPFTCGRIGHRDCEIVAAGVMSEEGQLVRLDEIHDLARGEQGGAGTWPGMKQAFLPLHRNYPGGRLRQGPGHPVAAFPLQRLPCQQIGHEPVSQRPRQGVHRSGRATVW